MHWRISALTCSGDGGSLVHQTPTILGTRLRAFPIQGVRRGGKKTDRPEGGRPVEGRGEGH
jgi:hypothetical protein